MGHKLHCAMSQFIFLKTIPFNHTTLKFEIVEGRQIECFAAAIQYILLSIAIAQAVLNFIIV